MTITESQLRKETVVDYTCYECDCGCRYLLPERRFMNVCWYCNKFLAASDKISLMLAEPVKPNVGDVTL